MNMSNTKQKYFYAVKNGRNIGIYTTWDECKEQVDKFPNPIYKKFKTYDEADIYIKTLHDKPSNTSNISNTSDIRSVVNVVNAVNVVNNNINSSYILPKKVNSDIFNIENDYASIDRWNKFDDRIYIFTDGSNKGSQKMNNKMCGIGIYLSPECLNIKNIYYGNQIMTNNRCELLAVLYSLLIINKYIYNHISSNNISSNNISSINIVSDSTYTVNSCNEWIEKWRENGWKTSNGTPVKNQDIMENIYINIQKIKTVIKEKLNTNITINIIHTNSHKNISDISNEFEKFLCFGNNIADKLAQNEL